VLLLKFRTILICRISRISYTTPWQTIYVTSQFAIHLLITSPHLALLPNSFVLKVQLVLSSRWLAYEMARSAACFLYAIAKPSGIQYDLGRRVGRIHNQDHKMVSDPIIFYELLVSDFPDSEETNALTRWRSSTHHSSWAYYHFLGTYGWLISYLLQSNDWGPHRIARVPQLQECATHWQ
jgi:hypothetical protein